MEESTRSYTYTHTHKNGVQNAVSTIRCVHGPFPPPASSVAWGVFVPCRSFQYSRLLFYSLCSYAQLVSPWSGPASRPCRQNTVSPMCLRDGRMHDQKKKKNLHKFKKWYSFSYLSICKKRTRTEVLPQMDALEIRFCYPFFFFFWGGGGGGWWWWRISIKNGILTHNPFYLILMCLEQTNYDSVHAFL